MYCAQSVASCRQRMRRLGLTLAVLGFVGCGDGAPTSDGGRPDAAMLAPWPHTLPASETLGTRGDLVVSRTILHAHSPISHDACDGMGFADGQIADTDCLAHLRSAVCSLHIDVLNLTDHAAHISELSFEELFSKDSADDEVRNEAGELVATRVHCADGSTTLITVGSENELMPVGLHRHVVEDATIRESAYHADGPAAVSTFHEAGALVFVPHTEQRSLDYLRMLGADGMEIYNIHANVDLDIRPMWLGLGATDYIGELLKFTNRATGLEPDLSFLAFFSENQNDLGKWDALLADGHALTAIAGSDCHENSFPMRMPDGERGDSYRRMMRWFTNHLLVHERSYEGQREALLAGRSYVAFEVFGSPVGFAFTAQDEAETFEMGDTASLGSSLHVMRPTLSSDMPSTPAPTITLRILKAEAEGAVVVASGIEDVFAFTPSEAGAYRAEVRIVPSHARPYLGAEADLLVHDYVWIYSNAIFVGATERLRSISRLPR